MVHLEVEKTPGEMQVLRPLRNVVVPRVGQSLIASFPHLTRGAVIDCTNTTPSFLLFIFLNFFYELTACVHCGLGTLLLCIFFFFPPPRPHL